jgi:hypothetical protein
VGQLSGVVSWRQGKLPSDAVGVARNMAAHTWLGRRLAKHGHTWRGALGLVRCKVQCGVHDGVLKNGVSMEWILTCLFGKHKQNIPLNEIILYVVLFFCVS